MKYIFSIILFYASCSIFAQDKFMPKVCGITFGSSYETVEYALESRHGEKSPYSTRFSIEYYDFHMGNFIFDNVNFEFQYDVIGKSYFNYAIFSSHFDLKQEKEAKYLLKSLVETLSKKYDVIHRVNSDTGNEFYLCGDDPFEDRYLIALNMEKSISNGGDWYFYVNLSYGPINFVSSTSDF